MVLLLREGRGGRPASNVLRLNCFGLPVVGDEAGKCDVDDDWSNLEDVEENCIKRIANKNVTN